MSKPDIEKRRWVSTAIAAEELGFSRRHLLKLKKDGLLKVGKHWIDVRRTISARATYRWNVDMCLKALEISPEKRPE